MGKCHLGPTFATHHQDRRREDEQGGGACCGGHARDPGGFVAAVREDACNKRQAVADVVEGAIEDFALFVEGAGMDFRGMAIDGDGGQARRGCDLFQVARGFRPVDFVVRSECQQCRWNDAGRPKIFEACHVILPGSVRRASARERVRQCCPRCKGQWQSAAIVNEIDFERNKARQALACRAHNKRTLRLTTERNADAGRARREGRRRTG